MRSLRDIGASIYFVFAEECFHKTYFFVYSSQLSKEKWTEKETKNQRWSDDRTDKIAVGVWRIWKWGVEQ